MPMFTIPNITPESLDQSGPESKPILHRKLVKNSSCTNSARRYSSPSLLMCNCG